VKSIIEVLEWHLTRNFRSNSIVNSSVPVVTVYTLGDIDAHNVKHISNAFYSDGKIEHWEINESCSTTR